MFDERVCAGALAAVFGLDAFRVAHSRSQLRAASPRALRER